MIRLGTVGLVTLLLSSPVHAGRPELPVPRLPIFPTPLVRKAIPVTEALSEIGGHLQDGYVLFGIEVRLVGGKEPTVDLNVVEGETLSEAMKDVLRQLPGYRIEVVSGHLINIFPQGAKDDPKDPHNLRVGRFDAVNEPPDKIINYLEVYILDLKRRLVERSAGPPYPIEAPSIMTYSAGPHVTLHLRNVTVREILNAVSEATQDLPSQYSPLSWVAFFRSDPAWAVGGTYSWRPLLCAPEDWKNYSKPAPATEKDLKKPAASPDPTQVPEGAAGRVAQPLG